MLMLLFRNQEEEGVNLATSDKTPNACKKIKNQYYSITSSLVLIVRYFSQATLQEKKIKIMKTSLWIGAFKLKINFVGREKGLDNHNLIS